MKQLILLLLFCVSLIESASTPKVALITGVTGQDGSYLAEFLLSKGYIVHGIKRRGSLINNTKRVDHIYEDPSDDSRHQRFFLHYGEMTDSMNIMRLIQEIQPDEIYNLAAQSHVQVSFEEPIYTAQADGIGALNVLEAIRILGMTKKVRFYQASTSEMFGKVQEIPQKETTPFYPRSPYGVSKLYAHWITKNFREAYGIFAVSGILFNHESPRRGETFVTRKIAQAVARVASGQNTILHLGNLDACRDWGHARDYIEAMWLMLQQDEPLDFVIATGQTHSVREFVELAFKEIGVEIEWQGTGLDEIGVDKNTGKKLVAIDARYFRPTEVEYLLGDATLAKQVLGWEPKTTFYQLVSEMVQAEMQAMNLELTF